MSERVLTVRVTEVYSDPSGTNEGEGIGPDNQPVSFVLDDDRATEIIAKFRSMGPRSVYFDIPEWCIVR